jgi:signal transduction histidine kinase
MFGTVLDITDRIRAEEEARIRQQQLVQADKMVSLGILVSGVAHEINNPNHSIMSNVSSLADVWTSVQPILDGFYKDFGDFVLGGFEYSECRDKLPEMFARALASSERIRVIVDELRDFARYSPQEQMTTVDVNAVVESASILMSNMIRKSTDHFEVSRAGHLPPIRGNFQRLEQVVINLIQNACRSLADRDKSIQVITGYDANSRQIRIEVIDEGAGISEENLKHLGDPFFTTKRSAGGMGLGLWVSFNIVHEHGGTLTYSSKPGEGTRAVLALPMSQNNDSPESSEQNATDQA